jgi:putative flippase GtrA
VLRSLREDKDFLFARRPARFLDPGGPLASPPRQHHAGLRIHEVPVDWIDDPDSRVDIVRTAISDLKGCWRVGCALATGALPVRELRHSLGREPLVPGVPHGMVGQLVRFGIVGIASTVAYALLYLVLHSTMGAQAANLTALLLTAIGNTAANRAFTFGIRGRGGAARHQLHGLLVFAFGLAITSGSLFVLHRFDPTVGRVAELSVLVCANLVATLIRFVALRRLFGMHRRTVRQLERRWLVSGHEWCALPPIFWRSGLLGPGGFVVARRQLALPCSGLAFGGVSASSPQDPHNGRQLVVSGPTLRSGCTSSGTTAHYRASSHR